MLGHARRKFHEIHIAHASPSTFEAIERIAALYAIEAEIRGSTAEVRKTIRQARARPLLDSMRTWLEDRLAKLSRKSDTVAAMRSRAGHLTRYVDNGQLEIDNNTAERALPWSRLAAELPLRRFKRWRRTHRSYLLAAWHRQA